MGKSKDPGPLSWNVPIVDVRSGRPSPEFQRRWETQRSNFALIGTITFGSGAPTGTPDDGAEYVDTSVTPYTLYLGKDGAWNQVSAKVFTDLGDVPHSYIGSAGYSVRVKLASDGLEFVTQSDMLDEIGPVQGDILYRGSAGWLALAPGTSGQVLTTMGAGADPMWVTPGGGGSTLTIVQHTINAYNATDTNTPTAVFGTGPISGNLMVVIGISNSAPAAGSGWIQAALATNAQNIGVYYRYAGASEPASQTPIATGNGQWALEAWEISGVSGTWAIDFIGSHPVALATGYPGTSGTSTPFSTTNTNVLILAFAAGNATTSGTVYSTSTGTSDDSWPGTTLDGLGTYEVAEGWHYAVPTSGTSITSTITSNNGANMSYCFVELK